MNTSAKPTAQAKKEQTAREAVAALNAKGSTLAPKPKKERVKPRASSRGRMGASLDTQEIAFHPEMLRNTTLPNQMCIIVDAYYNLCDALDIEYGEFVKVSELNNSITWNFKQDATTVIAHYRKCILGEGTWKPRQSDTICQIGSFNG
mgnify:CR=1 FL=1